MPRPIPDSLAAGFPEGLQPVTHVSEDTLRVLGGTGLPGDQAITRMDGSGNSPEVGELAWDVANRIHDVTTELFGSILPVSIAVPELSAFSESGVDFAALQAGYEAYEKGGLRPELVFAPVNLGVSQWKANYSALRQWQDRNDSGSVSRLKNADDIDGLYIWDNVADSWDKLIQAAVTAIPGATVQGEERVIWKALVVPTASKAEGGIAVNTSFNLSKQSPQFINQTIIIGLRVFAGVEAHMPVGAYLTLQAVRIFQKSHLIDADTWTWNAGTFQEGNSLQAPASRWSPNGGRVRVGHREVGGSRDSLGVRVPVWGKS
jgi:hypothetical protein